MSIEKDHSKYLNQKYGRLTINSIFQHKSKHLNAVCVCECGVTKTVNLYKVLSGHTKSCGCLSDELRKSGGPNKRHGHSSHRLHRIWSHMKARCHYLNDPKYYVYGARGIILCDSWRQDFAIFLEWALNNGYKDGLTIERIDVNGNYEPSNCTWISMPDQGKNKQNSTYITFNGEKDVIGNWATRTGIPRATLLARVKKGCSIERIFDPVGSFYTKKVLILDKNSNPLMIVESVTMAAKVSKSHLSGVSAVLTGVYKQWHGLIFKYYKEAI